MNVKTIGRSVADYITKAHSLPPRIHAALRSKAFEQAGTESFLGMLASPIANRLVGKRKFQKAMFKYMHESIRKVDAVLGQMAGDVAKKITPFDKVFVQKELVPMGGGWHKQIERPSAVAPLGKVRDLAVPLVVGLESEKLLRKHQEMKDQELRKKAAAKMLQLHEENKQHEKRARAIRLIYKQAEAGFSPIPRTYSELQEKVASLLKEDLNVMEKAVEMSQGATFQKMGSLDVADPSAGGTTPETQFQAAVINTN